MSTWYVESSALLAWMFGEPDGERVRSEIGSAAAVVTSSLTFLEAERALVRAVNLRRRARGAAARSLRRTLSRQRESWIVAGIDDAILERAGRAFPVEPLRALDSIHLATAARFAEAFPDLRVLTLDRRIAENAKALGLASR